MPENPYDKFFDAESDAGSMTTNDVNPYDKLIGGESSVEPSSLIRRGIGDAVVSLAKGALVGIPETLTGLADLAPTPFGFGMAGKATDWISDKTGIPKFKEANQLFDQYLSPETQEAKRKVGEAEGFIPSLTAALQNPSYILEGITSNLPSMYGGASLGKYAMMAMKFGPLAKGITEAQKLLRGQIGGAIGEGLVTAGQNTEQVRQDLPEGVLTPKQAALMGSSAFLTGLLGFMGGKLSARLGIDDIDTLLAGGGHATEKATTGIYNVLKKVIGGAISEGAIEELPQSLQEQVAQNLAEGKPAGQGVAEAGAQGMLLGAAMGGLGAGGGHLLQKTERPREKTPVENTLESDPIASDIESQLAAVDTDGVTKVDIPENVVTPAPVEEEIDKELTPQTQPPSENPPEPPIIQSAPEPPPTNLPAHTEIVDSGANGGSGGAKADEQGAEEVNTTTESPDWVKQAIMDAKGEAALDELSSKGETVDNISKKFWDETYWNLPAETQRVFQKYLKGLTGWEPGSTIAFDRDSNEEIKAIDWIDIAKNTDLSDEINNLEGTQRGYVVLMDEANKRFGQNESAATTETIPAIPESTPSTPDYESEAKSLGLIYKGRMGNVPGKPDMIHFTDPTNAAGSFSLLDGESLPDKLAKEREKKQKGLTPEQIESLGKGVENVPKVDQVEKVAEVDQVSKEPWQMTAVESRKAFPTLTQGKWDDAVTAAWKDGRLTEDSAPVQSMIKAKPSDFGEIDAVINGRMTPSKELISRHPELAEKNVKTKPTVAKGTQETKAKIEKIKGGGGDVLSDNKVEVTSGGEETATARPDKSSQVKRGEAKGIQSTTNPKVIKKSILSQLEPLIVEARNKWKSENGMGPKATLTDKDIDERVLKGTYSDIKDAGKVTISYPGGQYTPNNTLKSLLFLRGKVKSLPVNPPSTTISKPSTKPTGKSPDEIFKESEREVMESETVREGAKNDYEYMVNESLPAAEQRVDEINNLREEVGKGTRTLKSLAYYKSKDGVKLFGGRVPSSDSLRDMSREADDRVSKIKKEIAEKKKDIITAYPDMAKEMFPNEKIEKLKFGDVVPYQEFFKSGLRRDQRLFTKKSSDILNGIRKTGEISQDDRDWYAKEFGEDNTKYDIAYQRLRGSFPLTKEERNVLVNKHGEDWVLTREKRHKTHIKLVRENDKFGTIQPEDQWNGYGDSLSPTVRQQWQSKLEEFENELQGTQGENRALGTTNDTNMGRPDGVSDARRLQYRRLFDEQVRISNQEGSGDHWEGVQVNTNFAGTKEFQLAEKHFNSYGYQVVPISRVDWGGAVNHDTKTVFLGEMSGDKYAYIMSHETSHILTKQGNAAALAVKNNINPNHPEVLKARSKRGWDLDHTKDEFAASIIGGMDENIDMLMSDQTENIKQAREAAGGGNNNIKTNTPEFKKWFGDSKVVDENGEPLVVYHGTGEEFTVPNNEYWTTKYPDQASGISELRAALRGGSANVQPVYLSIKNPYIFISSKEDISAEEKLADLPSKYDGMIIDGIHFVAIEPNQIKSSTANVGTYDANNPDIRYGDIIPASIKQSITDLTTKFQSNPQSTVPDAWLKDTLKPFLKETSPTEFRNFEKYVGLPWTNAKKWVKEWGGAVKILLIERPEERARLQHEFSRIAEPFFTLADRMRKAGRSKESITDSQDRLARVIITGDAQLGAELKSLRSQYRELKDGPEREIIANKIAQIEQDNRYSDEQLLSGIKDDRGKTVKLNQQEIEAYKAVRSSLDFMFDSYMDHLLTQTFRNYKNQKWYSILAQAVGMDLTKEQTINIVGKGLNKAALLKSKSIQPNIHRIFNRVDQAITETPDNEKMEAGKLYAKLADKMTKEISELRNAISELSGVTDPAQLNKMTKDVFDAYLFTRPATKQIKAMRNQYRKHVAFFPRVREQAKYKLQAVRNVYDEEGNLKEQVKLYSDFFNTESEGKDLYSEILDRFGKDGKLPNDIEVLPPEPATQAPEFAFQGVNDINVQKIFDNAIKEMKIESTFFNEKGEEVNIQNHLQRLGYEAIAKQFQSRGFGRHMIHRQMNVVKGYKETGLEKTLYDYISGMSGIMTKQVAAADYLDHMKTVKDPKQFVALAKYGSDQFRNDTMADRISSKVRSAMFTWYIGGVLRPAIIQATQNFVTGIPKHAQYLRENKLGGAGKADIDYIKSMKDMALFAKIGKKYQDWRYEAQDKGKELTLKDKENWLKSHGSRLSAIEADMQAQLLTDGITVDQFIREIKGSIGNRWANGAERWLDYLSYPFSRMEIFNRQSAALTRFRPAYKLAMAKVGKEIDGEVFTEEDACNEAFDSSRKFVYDTHYPVGKANLPQVAQGPGLGIALKTGYTFKTFTHNFALQTYYDMAAGDWKTWTHSMAYLALFGGLMGLPFFKDLFEFIEKYFGYSPANEVRQLLRGMGGKTLEQFGMNGLPAMLGMNMSGSLAMGVPFMGEDPSTTLSGVYGGQLQKVGRAWDAYTRKDYYRVAANLAPEMLRGPITAAQESQVGKEVFGTPGSATTTRGGLVYDKNGKPLSMTGYQAALKSIGFQPEEYSREREMDATIKRQKAWVDGRKSDIAETYRVMKINKDPDAMKDMYKAVQELKQDIKDRDLTDLVPRVSISKIIQSSRQIKTLQERRQEKYKRAEL